MIDQFILLFLSNLIYDSTHARVIWGSELTYWVLIYSNAARVILNRWSLYKGIIVLSLICELRLIILFYCSLVKFTNH